MTIRDRVKGHIGFEPNKETIDGALIDFDLDGTISYVKADHEVSCKRCAISIMKVLLTTADTTDGNQMSIKYDRSALQKRITDLETELDGDQSRTIRAVSVW